MRRSIAIICAMTMTISCVVAQIIEPIHWSIEINDLNDTICDVQECAAAPPCQEVLIKAQIDEGWHLYSQSIPEGGPIATSFSYEGAQASETSADITLYGTTTTDAPLISAYDENFEMLLSYYEGTVVFRQLTSKGDVSATVRYMACNDAMCLPPTEEKLNTKDEGQGTKYDVLSAESADNSQSGDRSLLTIFLLGLLGGLLAIFTPCVWPIIPMTVSFFIKRGGGLRSAMLYGIAIIIIYVGLGLLLTVIFGASALNSLSTNAIVNLVFFAILVIFALSFFGLFEITLPSSWSTHFDNRASSATGFLSILFMAFTLVIVSFSCTGPIIGTLLVEAAGKSLLAPAIGMLGFAIALALPFSLFAMFPEWLKKAPRSGDWMQSFKVVLAFIELALSLKFLSVADMAYGWGILPRWLFLTLWIIIFLAMGIYLLVGIKKISTTRKVIRIVLIIASWGFAAYLIPGLWGAPVKVVSAFAPPMPIEGREVFSDFDEGMAYARQEGKPVLLDFSGVGCVNCRKMEAYVLADTAVQARLKNYVLIELYVDIKGGEGEKNSRLQREMFGANAQPYYIQLSPNGDKISEPYAFSTNPQAFIEWLKISN